MNFCVLSIPCDQEFPFIPENNLFGKGKTRRINYLNSFCFYLFYKDKPK